MLSDGTTRVRKILFELFARLCDYFLLFFFLLQIHTEEEVGCHAVEETERDGVGRDALLLQMSRVSASAVQQEEARSRDRRSRSSILRSNRAESFRI